MSTKFVNINKGPDREVTVAIYFSVEFEVTAPGEPEAMLKVAPDVQRLEKILTEAGYDFRLEMARSRRPRAAEAAQEREATRKKERGEGV